MIKASAHQEQEHHYDIIIAWKARLFYLFFQVVNQ